MKSFSDFEKGIIHRIIELDDRCGLGVLNNILEGKVDTLNQGYIDLDITDNCVLIFDERALDGHIDLKTFLEELKKRLLATLALIKHLEIEGMVLVSATDLELQTLGSRGNFVPVTHEYNDAYLTKLIRDYAKKEIIPLEDLKALVARNFKSEEQIRHEAELAEIRRSSDAQITEMKRANDAQLGEVKRSKITASLAMGVSIVSIIVSAVVPFKVTSNVKFKDKNVPVNLIDRNLIFKLDEGQLNKVLDQLQSTVRNTEPRRGPASKSPR